MKQETTTVRSNKSIWSGSVTNEEQTRIPWSVGVALIFGTFLWMGPYMGVNAVLLPAKTAELFGDEKASVIAVLSASAMVVATLANIIFGALSDLTRSRWGRRTPWIVVGSLLSAIFLVALIYADSFVSLVATWCIFQCFLNAIIAPLIVVIADRAAPKFRGTITSLYALGYSSGIYIGQIIGAQFLTHVEKGIVVFAVCVAISGPFAAFFMREESSKNMPRKHFSFSVFIERFSFPVKNCRDYYLALLGKFLIVAAKFAISGFQLYILTDYMGQSTKNSGKYMQIISLCMMVAAILMTIVSGPISDKIGSRKLPVIVASLFIGVGSIFPFFSQSPNAMIVYAVVAGVGIGAYNSVDQALNIEVLPNEDTAAKDLGILNLANTGGQVCGPILAAMLIKMYGYHALFPLAAVCSLLGAILIVFIRKVK